MADGVIKPAIKRYSLRSAQEKDKMLAFPKKKRKINIKNEPQMDICLPSPQWFQEIGGSTKFEEATTDSGISGCSKTFSSKRRRQRKSKIKKNLFGTTSTSNGFDEVINISDGEDLYETFPMQLQQQNAVDCNFQDDNDDLIVLFERKSTSLESTGTNRGSETQQNFLLKYEKADIIDQLPPTLNNFSTTVCINWSRRYGVSTFSNKKVFKFIAKYRDKHGIAFKKFDKSIFDHMTENLQNDHTYIWKMRIKKVLSDMIQPIYPDQDYELVAVGSTVNGCGAFNSDMDLCLCLSHPNPDIEFVSERSYAIKNLKKIKRAFEKKSGTIRRVQYIPAKVPILKLNFNPPYRTLEVDINVNNVAGIYNSYLLHYYSRLDDRLAALCLLVKNWAKQRGIGDASTGFFNSYSLILMVVHFLQCGTEPPVLPNLQYLYPQFFFYNKPLADMKLFLSDIQRPPEMPQNDCTVGELLIAFFAYYNNFDFERHAISICRGEIFPRSRLPQNTERFKLFIEEPFDRQNTARCVTSDENWQLILDAFRNANNEFTPDRLPDLRNLIG